MATHSSVLAWRIPGTGEPGGLTSMQTHRVAHDWSDLAAAAAAFGSFYALVSGVDATYIVPFRPRNSRGGHIIYPRSPTRWWRPVTERCFVTWRLQTSVSTFQSKGGPWTLGHRSRGVSYQAVTLPRPRAASGALVVTAVAGGPATAAPGTLLGTDDFGHWKEAKAIVSCRVRKVEGPLPRGPAEHLQMVMKDW